MAYEHRARSFRSGNSVAIRLPAALGVEPGREWKVEKSGDGFYIAPAVDQGKIDLSDVWGSMPDLRPLTADDRAMTPRELDWAGELLKRG
jgi:antitoxin VapB